LKFLIDRCAGRRLAEWLRGEGHDVLEVRAFGRDPGDEALLRQAADQERVLVTIDSDFGTLIHLRARPHTGLIRLPDVPSSTRIELMTQILTGYTEEELSQALVTVKGSRIRVSRRVSAASRSPRG
jgi:predicted nuclease of predicted toxin-antitoxin system